MPSLDTSEEPPLTFDYRDLGLVQEVQNQFDCSASWAFSAVAAIEIAYAKYKDIKVKFSE